MLENQALLKKLFVLLLVVCPAFKQTAMATPLKSVTLLEFAADGHLVVIDAYEGMMYTFFLPQRKVAKSFYNVYDVEEKVAHHMKAAKRSIIVRCLAIHPSGEVYVGVDLVRPSKSNSGIVLSISEAGRVEKVPLADYEVKRVKIAQVPESYQKNLEQGGNQQAYFTALALSDSQCFISVHAKDTSKAKIITSPYPLAGTVKTAMVEATAGTYIRTFLLDKVAGKQRLLSVFSDGSLATLSFEDGTLDRKPLGQTMGGETKLLKLKKKYFFFSENYSMAAVAKKKLVKSSNDQDADSPSFPSFTYYPQNGILDIEDHHKATVLVLKRHHDTGTLDLLSIRKLMKLRLSEFETEYDFPDYQYKGFLNRIKRWVHKKLRAEENLSKATFK